MTTKNKKKPEVPWWVFSLVIFMAVFAAGLIIGFVIGGNGVCEPCEPTIQLVDTDVIEVAAMPSDEVFFELEGQGTLITENFDFAQCPKAAWYSTASAEDGALDAWIRDVDCEGGEYQCSEQVASIYPAGGETEGVRLAPIDGGTYYLEVKLAPIRKTTTWTLTGICEG